MQVPKAFNLPQAPVLLAGDVTTGFGRGSAAMGTPTANLPPEGLQEQLKGLPLGVYFGCVLASPAAACPLLVHAYCACW